MPGSPVVRPLAEADVAAAFDVSTSAFDALDAANHRPSESLTEERTRHGHARIAHLLETDPAGSWVAADGESVVGVALALRREQVWGLSLLTIHPRFQSIGLGRRLLDAALAYGQECRGGIILSSDDPRAMRRYARAGFSLLPGVRAVGEVRAALEPTEEVRPATVSDLELCAVASRAVRGAAHTADVRLALEEGYHVVVADRPTGVGFAVHRDGTPVLLAATRPAIAADLLRACLAAGTARVGVYYVTHAQPWAIDVALDAGLSIEPHGPVFVRGDVGPMTPYLPSAAYL